MDFRILGRLEVLDDGVDVAPRRAQPRSLLATLLLHPNELLTTDRLVEALWGETPPATADKALQGHVSVLRKALGHDRLVTERGGYRLRVEPGELDTDRFASAISAARAIPDPSRRARALADALASWRGDPLADLSGERSIQAEMARFATLRLTALEAWADAEVAAGNHDAILADLERAVADHPLSEGLRASLIRAQYRAGRQSDALRTYRDGRRLLAEELGIDPGAELQLLERQVLAQDPALDLPVADEPARAPRQERKTVTVLVVEVVPSTASDPEDLEREAQPGLDRIRAAIEQVGGRAEPLFANAIVGMFGAPRSHDDDALRAVRAALDLLDEQVEHAIGLRGGVETGEALVTIDGDDVSITGQVLGAASRLQATAPVGSIVVGPTTRRTTEGSIEYHELEGGSAVPRGLRRPEPSGRPEPPFIGRQGEIGQLEQIMAGTRERRAPQLVTVIAEPGGGKSRLIQELRARLEADARTQPMRWLQGRCLPYGRGLTFWALGEIVKEWAGILETDDAVASAEKLGGALHSLEPDDNRRTWLARSSGPLAGIDDPAAGGFDREQGFAAWRQLIEGIASDRSLVVTFEDIHWADDALLAFIDHLVDHAAGVPLLVLCTARPELLDARPWWGTRKRNATAITLEPLSDADTGALLKSLLGRAATPETVRRAGGNPLYARELARLIAHPGTEVGPIPASLQAVIAAHLDALTPELKVVAMYASVVGEVFWPGAVAAIAGESVDTVAPRLHRLVGNEVVRRRRRSSAAGEDEYEFLHVLVRDVAYSQIPRRDRIARHRAAAAWIEGLATDRPTAHAELAAHHWVEALELAQRLGDHEQTPELRTRAIASLAHAGDSTRTLDVAKAAEHYRRALGLMSDSDPARGGLLARLGDVAELAGELEEAERLTRNAVDALLTGGDTKAAAAAMVTLESVSWRLGRAAKDRRILLDEAITLLEALPPSEELGKAYTQTAAHELYAGSSAACLEWSRRALAVADALGMRSLQFRAMHYMGIGRFEQGDPGGIDDVRGAVAVGLELGMTWETEHAQADLGAMVWLQDGPAAALPIKVDAIAFGESRGMTGVAETTRAQMLWLQYDAGAWDEMLETAARLIDRAEDRRGRVAMMALSATARVLVGRDRIEEATGIEADVVGGGRTVGDAQDIYPSLATAAYVRSAVGDGAAALALIEEMEERSRGLDLSRRAHDLALVSRICLAEGAPELVRRFVPAVETPSPSRAKLALETARAVIAEGAGDFAIGARAWADVADGWSRYGFLEEAAHALLGEARCRRGVGDTPEPASLDRAEAIGAKLGASGIVAEARGLRGAAAPSQPA